MEVERLPNMAATRVSSVSSEEINYPTRLLINSTDQSLSRLFQLIDGRRSLSGETRVSILASFLGHHFIFHRQIGLNHRLRILNGLEGRFTGEERRLVS